MKAIAGNRDRSLTPGADKDRSLAGVNQSRHFASRCSLAQRPVRGSRRLFLGVAVVLSCIAPAAADEAAHGGPTDDGRLHRRTQSEVRAFLEEHWPEALTHPHHAEIDGHGEAGEEFWAHASRLAGEFYLAREELGEEAALALVRVHQLQVLADQLTEQIRLLDNENEAQALSENLSKVLGERFDLTMKIERARLERARAELDQTARKLGETAAQRAEIVRQELKQRLFGSRERLGRDHGTADGHRPEVARPETDDQVEIEREPREDEDKEPEGPHPPDNETEPRKP